MALFSRITSTGTTEFPLLDCGHYANVDADDETGVDFLVCARRCADAAPEGYDVDTLLPLEELGSRGYDDADRPARGCWDPRCRC
jgi:hypothetical protein